MKFKKVKDLEEITPEFTIIFNEGNIYSILDKDIEIGVISFIEGKKEIFIENFLIHHTEQLKGYGKKAIEELMKKGKRIWGYPVYDSMGFWYRLGVEFSNKGVDTIFTLEYNKEEK